MSSAIASSESPMQRWWRRILTVGMVFYPLLMHLLIVRGMLGVALSGLAIVTSAACAMHLQARRNRFQAACFGLIALTALVGLASGQALPL
jgi:MFS family permease